MKKLNHKIPPKTLPFHGDSLQAFLSAKPIIELLENSPAHPHKSNAILYLQTALTLAKAMTKIVHSIHWRGASAEVRLDVAQQLDILRAMVLDNLEKFMYWWNLYSEENKHLNLIDSISIPEYAGEDKEIYQRAFVNDLKRCLWSKSKAREMLSTPLVREAKR